MRVNDDVPDNRVPVILNVRAANAAQCAFVWDVVTLSRYQQTAVVLPFVFDGQQ